MAEREAVSRIAKILARATSDNANEAEASLKSAYARMKRDRVTVQDVLGLPTQEIYQDALVRLVDLIVKDQAELSPSAKRELYACYLQMVVSRFSGAAGEKGGEREPPRPPPKQPEPPPRREPPRQEQRQQEPPRKEPPRQEQKRPEPPPRQDEKEYKRENSNTPKPSEERQVDVGGPAFSFSPAAFFSALRPIFGRGSFLRCALREPSRAFHLIAISAIFGCALSGGLLLGAALIHSLGEFEPFGNIKLTKAFILLAIPGAVLKARSMQRNGWFSYW